MNETGKRMLTVGGAVITVLAIALSLLSFVAVSTAAATSMPSVTDIIPGEDGTSALTLPEGGLVDSDVLTPDDSTRSPADTARPNATVRPDATTAPDGSDTDMTEEGGGGVLGAIIAVIVVVAIILVVIALIPRKKR